MYYIETMPRSTIRIVYGFIYAADVKIERKVSAGADMYFIDTIAD